MEQSSGVVPPYSDPADGAGLSAHRVKVFFSVAVLVAAMGYLGFMAFESAAVYYYTVGELHEIGPTDDGRMVRVSGKLVPLSFVREPGSTMARFSVTDGTVTLDVMHQGVVPDLFFNDHSEIVLEGTFTEDGLFETQNVPIVKCPSKYVAAE